MSQQQIFGSIPQPKNFIKSIEKELIKLGLTRENNTSPETIREMMTFLNHKMEGPAAHFEYRYLWHQLKLENLS